MLGFLLKVLFLSSTIAGMSCSHTRLSAHTPAAIKVMVSNRAPFAFYDERKNIFKGLDVEIVENFGRKMNLAIELTKTNFDLLTEFSSADTFESFFNKTEHS